MSGSKGMAEEEVEAFLTKLKQAGECTIHAIRSKSSMLMSYADLDKKVDVVQLFGLKIEDAGEVRSSIIRAGRPMLITADSCLRRLSMPSHFW